MRGGPSHAIGASRNSTGNVEPSDELLGLAPREGLVAWSCRDDAQGFVNEAEREWRRTPSLLDLNQSE